MTSQEDKERAASVISDGLAQTWESFISIFGLTSGAQALSQTPPLISYSDLDHQIMQGLAFPIALIGPENFVILNEGDDDELILPRMPRSPRGPTGPTLDANDPITLFLLKLPVTHSSPDIRSAALRLLEKHVKPAGGKKEGDSSDDSGE